jgi:hypothetical protein
MIKVPKERRGKKERLGLSLSCIICAETKRCERGTTFDIGKGGMCVFSSKRLEVGHSIEIQCESIWEKPKIGTVKWCDKIEHNLYRVGILFS